MRISEITLCENVTYDETTQLQSLIGIRDFFGVPAFPCVLGSLFVSVAMELDGGEPDGQDLMFSGILELDGIEVFRSEKTIEWISGPRNMRIYFRSNKPILINEPGVLTAVIKAYPAKGTPVEKARDFGISLKTKPAIFKRYTDE